MTSEQRVDLRVVALFLSVSVPAAITTVLFTHTHKHAHVVTHCAWGVHLPGQHWKEALAANVSKLRC